MPNKGQPGNGESYPWKNSKIPTGYKNCQQILLALPWEWATKE